MNFTCISEQPVSWYHNEHLPLAAYVKEVKLSIYIDSVSVKDWGSYTCHGKEKSGFEFYAVANLDVKCTVNDYIH